MRSTILCVFNGMVSSGTCWECGYAFARDKTVVLFPSDMRRAGDEQDIPYNAMLIGAADAHIELERATLDEAAAAILAKLAELAAAS